MILIINYHYNHSIEFEMRLMPLIRQKQCRNPKIGPFCIPRRTTANEIRLIRDHLIGSWLVQGLYYRLTTTYCGRYSESYYQVWTSVDLILLDSTVCRTIKRYSRTASLANRKRFKLLPNNVILSS